jgi:predicted GH43/DUF377 family glycosyl hydrolase
MTPIIDTDLPYRLTRLGVIMEQDTSAFEAEGVLNPASGRSRDGRLWLLPRMAAAGNVSRIGLAELLIRDGRPVGVRREGVVLAPDSGWERSHDHAGVEDPRITWIPALNLHVMAYVAFGPLGPRAAIAVSEDLREWRRLGPAHFEYSAELDTDLNLFPNKDVAFFPEPVTGPDGRPALAMLHRPVWDLGTVLGGDNVYLPKGVDDPRPGIWLSYAPLDAVRADVRALTSLSGHRLVALPEFAYEAVKIGAGPPPIRVDEGWLLIHHGVAGTLAQGWGPQHDLRYSAGAMVLDGDDPGTVIARTAEPLLEPATAEEQSGPVPNVVFPTATEVIDDRRFVFYGMADSRIGMALLDRTKGNQ